MIPCGCSRRSVAGIAIRFEPGIKVTLEQIAHAGLAFGRQQLDAVERDTDANGFLAYQMPPGIETRDGAGKRKGQEQTQQPEDRAFDDAGTFLCGLGISRDARDRNAMTEMLHDEHADEQSSGECESPHHHAGRHIHNPRQRLRSLRALSIACRNCIAAAGCGAPMMSP